MADKYKLCSSAFALIGANRITSFSDGTTESDTAADLYEVVVERALSAHFWNFAKTEKDLGAPLADTPLNGFEYAFQKPNDPVILREIGVFFEGSDEPIPYQIASDKIFCNYKQDVFLRYIYSREEAFWPPYFTGAMLYELAGTFAHALDRAERGEALIRSAATLHWPQARTADSQAAPARKFRTTLTRRRF